jgi:hypothetical protein
MTKIKQTAFAAADMRSYGKPYFMAWTVSGTATGVRRKIGEAWCAEDPAEGWKAAKIEGIKVHKIAITSLQ